MADGKHGTILTAVPLNVNRFFSQKFLVTFLYLLDDLKFLISFPSIMLGTQWASHSGDVGHLVLI